MFIIYLSCDILPLFTTQIILQIDTCEDYLFLFDIRWVFDLSHLVKFHWVLDTWTKEKLFFKCIFQISYYKFKKMFILFVEIIILTTITSEK